MDDLLQLDVAIPEMADVLTEVCILNRITIVIHIICNTYVNKVFTDEIELCLMIEEQQIEQIFATITTNRITARSGHAELLNTLQAVVKVKAYN